MSERRNLETTAPKRFRIVIDGYHQPGGADTIEEAEHIVAAQFSGDKYFQIFDAKHRLYAIPGGGSRWLRAER